MADVQYLVDGTDLEVAGTRIMQVVEGGHVIPTLRGDPIPYPGRDGAVALEQAFDVNLISFGMMILGGSRQGFNDAYRTLKRLVKPGRTVTLSRVLSYTGGSETHTAAARFTGSMDPSQANPMNFRVLLRFLLLDGLWYGTPVTIGAGTNTVLGDVRTRRMTVTVSAGTNPTVTNNTNGWALTYTGSTSTAVAIDVENMTATQGASDVSGNLSFTKDWPMQLEAGSNSLTISSGTLSVAYSPAFL